MLPTPGDIAIVPFPYSDRLSEKRRPAVVVSASDLARLHGVVWLAMITSTSIRWTEDVAISDLASTGLPTACAVRVAKMATVSVSRIVRISGMLCPADWSKVQLQFARFLG